MHHSEQNKPATSRRPLFPLLLLLFATLVLTIAPTPAIAESESAPLTASETDIASPTLLENPLSIKDGTVSVTYSTTKSRTVAATSALTVRKAKGKVSFKKTSGSKRLTVRKNGKIAVAKNTAKGTYLIAISVTAAGNKKYAPATKVATVTVKVTAPKTVFIADSRTYYMSRQEVP